MRTENGFALVEMVLVLLIVAVCGMVTVTQKRSGLALFMDELEGRIVAEQIRAYSTGQDRELMITGSSLETEDDSFLFPSGTACTPFEWHYTSAGTISVGGTVSCTAGGDSRDLVFRIGAGRIRQ